MTEIFRRQVGEEVTYLAPELRLKARKLKAVWSQEAEQDLRFHINSISQQLVEQIQGLLSEESPKINWKEEGF